MSHSDSSTAALMAAKAAMRVTLLERRRKRPAADRAAATEQILTALLHQLPTRHALTVAAYSPSSSEPGGPLPHRLHAAGHTVLLPVLRDDNDLDWTRFTGELVPAGRGLKQAPGPPLGPSAIATADLVVVPALAVDADGRRLGRGGGSYDRALARVAAEIPVIALLFDDEWPRPVPVLPHDRAVNCVVTPTAGYRRLVR